MVERGVIETARRVGAVYLHALGPAALARQKLTLPIGRCLEATVAIGSGAEGVELRFLGSDGAELALVRGDSTASTRICARDSETNDSPEVTAELRVLGGSATGLFTAHLTDPARKPGPLR
jgi:hypothetical protein